MSLTRILALSVLAIAWPMNSLAQAPSTDQINEANNPLTPKLTINLQDQ